MLHSRDVSSARYLSFSDINIVKIPDRLSELDGYIGWFGCLEKDELAFKINIGDLPFIIAVDVKIDGGSLDEVLKGIGCEKPETAGNIIQGLILSKMEKRDSIEDSPEQIKKLENEVKKIIEGLSEGELYSLLWELDRNYMNDLLFNSQGAPSIIFMAINVGKISEADLKRLGLTYEEFEAIVRSMKSIDDNEQKSFAGEGQEEEIADNVLKILSGKGLSKK